MASTSAGYAVGGNRAGPSFRTGRAVNGMSPKTAQNNRGWENGNMSPQEYQGSPPPVPEVPRGPPLSYKEPYARESGPPRSSDRKSFSERAKVSPIPDDDYAEDSYWGPSASTAVQPPNQSRRGSAGREPQSRRNPDPQSPRYSPDPRQRNTAKEVPHPRVVIPNGAVPVSRSKSINQPSQRHSESPRYVDQTYSPISRSATIRGPVNVPDEKRREWASDRSPLQKLEVTLNDISKEEKRARVEEAEMLLRESRAGRGGRKASKDVGNKARTYESESSRADPKSLEEAGLVRSSSGAQRDKLYHSSTLESRRPDTRQVSVDGRRGFEYEERQNTADPVRQTSVSTPRQARSMKSDQAEPTSRIPPIQKERPVTVRQDPDRRALQGTNASRGQGGIGRSQSKRQAVQAQGIPSNITRAVSMAQSGPQTTFPEERDIHRGGPMKESNSSHKAVLAESAPATAVTEAPKAVVTSKSTPVASGSIGRSNSRKLQKRAPAGYISSAKDDLEESQIHDQDTAPEQSAYMAQKDSYSQPSYNHTKNEPYSDRPRSPDARPSTSKKHLEPHGLGLHHDAPVEAGRKHSYVPDIFHHKSRRQSVSFKEPFDRARPVNEWKNAGTARLTFAELQLSEAGPDKSRTWWEGGGSVGHKMDARRPGAHQKPRGAVNEHGQTTFNPPLYFKCGPLLRYTGMKRQQPRSGNTEPQTTVEREMWRGSVMIVTQDSMSSYETVPVLRLFSQPTELLPPPPQQISGDEEDLAPEYVDPLAGLTKMSRNGKTLYVRPVDHLEEGKDLSLVEEDYGLFEESPSPIFANGGGASHTSPVDRSRGPDGEEMGKWSEVTGVRLYADPARDVTFWRFNLEIELSDRQAHIAYRINNGPAVGFWVPARGQAMNIMFHSCNGFSLSVNPNEFSGPDPLWRDVLNTHQTRPFHVMIGGGDQIYNDRVMVETTHFAEWTRIKNPHEKHHTEFTSEMKEELETFYLNRYSMWFSQGLFGMANSQIPMVNVWDDHDSMFPFRYCFDIARN